MVSIEDKIAQLAHEYSERFKRKINERIVEMERDDRSYYLLYKILDISSQEGG